MADFSQVQSIQTSAADNKGFLQIKVAGATEPLTITCASVDDAEDMADLIDGYCRLVHDISTSVWSRKGEIIIDLLCNDKWRTIYQNSKMYVEWLWNCFNIYKGMELSTFVWHSTFRTLLGYIRYIDLLSLLRYF